MAARLRLLHVTNGESAGNTLRRTPLGGAVLPWQDVLHAGPVPDVARRKLLPLRAGFLSDCGWGGRRALLSSLERRDRQFLEALRDGVQVVLWFEHDLYDQLQLLDALVLASEVGASPELIVVGAFPGRPGFAGLGELTADELATLWPRREPALESTLEAAVSVWGAFRSPDPAELATWAAREIPGLPFVASALGRVLEELPAPRDGLSATERYALEAVASGAATPFAAFLAAQRSEKAPFLGDTWFFRSLVELGSGDVRLVETAERESLPAAPPLSDGHAFGRLPLRLTREGERVLAGELDRVELMGVDRWLGGTHVSVERVRRWDPASRTLS